MRNLKYYFFYFNQFQLFFDQSKYRKIYIMIGPFKFEPTLDL